MIALRLVHLIEQHSDALAIGLLHRFLTDPRTSDLRKVPEEELRHRSYEIYHNLGHWLLGKSRTEIDRLYHEIGVRRARQGVAYTHLLAALLLTKEHLWEYLHKEAREDNPIELFGELELLRLMEQFFDRAIYQAALGYEEAAKEAHAA